MALVPDAIGEIFDRCDGPTKFIWSMVDKFWYLKCCERQVDIWNVEQARKACREQDIFSVVRSFEMFDDAFWVERAGKYSPMLLQILLLKRSDNEISINWAAVGAAASQIPEMLDYVLMLGVSDKKVAFNSACRVANVRSMQLLLADGVNPSFDDLGILCKHGSVDLIAELGNVILLRFVIETLEIISMKLLIKYIRLPQLSSILTHLKEMYQHYKKTFGIHKVFQDVSILRLCEELRPLVDTTTMTYIEMVRDLNNHEINDGRRIALQSTIQLAMNHNEHGLEVVNYLRGIGCELPPFAVACSTGKQEFIDLYQPDWLNGFPMLCETNNMALIKRVMATPIVLNYQQAFYQACGSGQLENVKLLLPLVREVNDGLTFACKFHHVPVVDYLMKASKPDQECGFFGALHGANQDLLIRFMNAGKLDDALHYAVHVNFHVKLIKFLIANGAQQCSCGMSLDDVLAYVKSEGY